MPLSYVENDTYFLTMEPFGYGDCVIILRKKIDENHGKKIYVHTCGERSKDKDFAIYYDLEEKIKNNTLTDEYVEELKK